MGNRQPSKDILRLYEHYKKIKYKIVQLYLEKKFPSLLVKEEVKEELEGVQKNGKKPKR